MVLRLPGATLARALALVAERDHFGLALVLFVDVVIPDALTFVSAAADHARGVRVTAFEVLSHGGAVLVLLDLALLCVLFGRFCRRTRCPARLPPFREGFERLARRVVTLLHGDVAERKHS